MHVVTANKGPLVLAYDELTALAQRNGVQLGFCGTVAGGLPAINLGQRDLAGADDPPAGGAAQPDDQLYPRPDGPGQTYAQALAAAQAQGCAEADPSLDVEGWDAANKLVILANSVLGMPATPGRRGRAGHHGRHPGRPGAGQSRTGQVIKLVATASPRGTRRYTLTVAPTPLPMDAPPGPT